MSSKFLTTFAILVASLPALADGICPTTDVAGTYRVKSVSCSDGQEALHNDLTAIEVKPVSNTPEGIDSEIDFVGWNIAWGVYHQSIGGNAEACQDSANSKFIRKNMDGAVEEVEFSASGASLVWPFYGSGNCLWSLVKN